MSRIPDIAPMSDFRQDAASVLKRLQSGAGQMVVTRRGRAIAVMQSVDSYEKRERELELLRVLATGEREIATGKGHSLVSVMKEADAQLGEEESR